MAAPRTLCNFLDHISCRLNDHEAGYEFTRWSREFLVEAANTALLVLRGERPDLFIEVVPFTLQGGCAQQIVPDDCELHSVAYTELDCADDPDITGQCISTTPAAVMPTELDPSLSRLAGALASRTCAPLTGDSTTSDEPYQVQGWEFSPETGGRYFTVTPTPPRGETTVVNLNCIRIPEPLCVPASCPSSEPVLPATVQSRLTHYLPFLEEYVMYVAHMRDDTSNATDQRAIRHLDTAMALIGRTKVADYMQHRDNMHLVGPTEDDRDNFTIQPRGGI